MKKRKHLALLLFLCGLFPVTATCETAPVRLYCLNIGKADCMLLQANGKTFLIDTGYAHTYPALETALRSLDIHRLDGVFLTHCHKDHDGGLEALAASSIPIGCFYAAAVYHDVKEHKHPAVLAAKERSMSVQFLRSGDVIDAGSGASFTVLGPVVKNTENENNNSLVLRFDSEHGSILFCGDMKEEEEYTLLQKNLLSPADVIKCGHHGDSGATSAALLNVVKPRCALILTSTFEESDTPAASTLRRLKQINCQSFVTQDAEDAILLEMHRRNLSISSITFPGLPEKLTSLAARIAEDDTLLLANTSSETINLTGARLYSTQGEDLFLLPDIILAPGEIITIAGKSSKEDAAIRLDKKNVWHDKKRDLALLYDAYGRLLAAADNGLPE